MPPRRRRPRGHVEQLPSGRCRARVYAGTDPLTGPEHYFKETAPDYDSALKALTRLQTQVDEDQAPKSNITVAQAIEQWLEVAALEETTRERYQDLIQLYIMPTFGKLPAAKLDAELLERFNARLHNCREICVGRPRARHQCRPLSTSTTRKIHYIIRAAPWNVPSAGTTYLSTRPLSPLLRLPSAPSLTRPAPTRRHACSTKPGETPSGAFPG